MEEEPLSKKKQKQEQSTESDLAWGIKFFAEGVQSLTKQITSKKTSKDLVKHNEALIEKLKAEIENKKTIEAQYQEYRKLVQELKAMQKAEAEAKAARLKANPNVKKQ